MHRSGSGRPAPDGTRRGSETEQPSNNNGQKRGAAGRRSAITFKKYTRSPAFSRGWSTGTPEGATWRRRLASAAGDIQSLEGLQCWMRLNYPDVYHNGTLFTLGLTGREIMRKLWAHYLEWADECRR